MSSLLVELENALLSTASAEAVRVWMWLRICEGGECPLSTLYSRWPNLIGSGVKELVRRNLIVINGSRVSTQAFPLHTRPDISRRPIRKKVSISSPVTPTLPDKSDVITPEKISRPPEPSPRPSPSPEATPAEEGPAPEAPESPGEPSSSRGAPESKPRPFSGREALREAFKAPRKKASKEVIEEGCRWVFRRYNAARRRHGVREYSPPQYKRNRTKWKELARYLVEGDHQIDAFFDFAYNRSRWQKTAFPTPSFVAGDWLRDEWEGSEEVAGVSSSHAGARYASTSEDSKELVRRLAAGLYPGRELDEETVDYLIEQAQTLRATPHLYTPDPEFAELEAELAEANTNN